MTVTVQWALRDNLVLISFLESFQQCVIWGDTGRTSCPSVNSRERWLTLSPVLIMTHDHFPLRSDS